MISIRTCAVLAFSLMLVLISAAFAEVHASDAAVPKWGLQVVTFGGSGGMAGAYRRISDRHDLGVMMDGSLSGADQEDESYDHLESSDQPPQEALADSRQDQDHLMIYAAPELRRWNRLGARISAYRSIQCWVRHRESASDGHAQAIEEPDGQRILDTRSEDRSTELGLGLGLGAKLEVTEHLGLMMALRPLSVDYSWRRSESSYTRIYMRQDSDRTDRAEGKTVRKDDGPSLDWDLEPALLVTISF